MYPPIPDFRDYDVSEQHGFLPNELPLERLPHPYYARWEMIMSNMQPLLLSKRLRGIVQNLPVLSTDHLNTPGEWRRAYLVLSFILHGYVWGADRPEERVPPSVSIPFLQVTSHLELPPVATYAATCLWNFKPIFHEEPIDSLENLTTLHTFTGSLDETWFYLISVVLEARGAHIIPMMLSAMQSARDGDSAAVTRALQTMAESIDELGTLLNRMYENCDPHMFYHRIRPFLAGSRNMADAGLVNGLIFEDGSGTEQYQQWGGASNAQSSLIQFFDIVLGVVHRPTGTGPDSSKSDSPAASSSSSSSPPSSRAPSPQSPPPTQHNFIHEMRSYMPGPHARFLRDVSAAANIRAFVSAHPANKPLTLAYDACLAMVRAMRDKHIRMVTRYIIVKSRESRSVSADVSGKVNLASGTTNKTLVGSSGNETSSGGKNDKGEKGDRSDSSAHAAKQRGTGGTALIPFLKQARDETGEPAVDAWAKRLLGDKPVSKARRSSGVGGSDFGLPGPRDRVLALETVLDVPVGVPVGGARGVKLGAVQERKDGDREIVGLAGTWEVGDEGGGLCHW